MNSIRRISRRQFLTRTGQATGGMVLAVTLAPVFTPGNALAGPPAKSVLAPNVFVNVREDGIVEIYCYRSEMGQGIRTGLPQVIADELEADWDRISVIQAQGDEKYGDQNTDGSTSIRKHFDVLRTAGASAREMLVAAAAQLWNVPVGECEARNHAVRHRASGKRAGYGELVPHTAGIAVPEAPTFKARKDYRYIGKPMDLLDAKAMTTGTAMYGIDTVLLDMLYASIERCPAQGGLVRSFDASAARKIPGVVAVYELPKPSTPPLFNVLGGVAVLATNTWSAQQGRAALKIEWDHGVNGAYDSENYRKELVASTRNPGTLMLNRGDISKATQGAASSHSADYYAPHLSQAPMEPPAAVASVADGSCEVWACTQNPQETRDTVATTIGMDKDRVAVNVTLLGGGFGRKSKPDFAAEAAWLSKQSGRPVKVTWTREDDLRHGYFHSVSAQHVEANLDEAGMPTSWLHRTAFPSISSTFDSSNKGPSAGELTLGLLDIPYAIPNLRIEAGDAVAHVRIGWLRSVCNVYHAFALSSFADELAQKSGTDPVAYLAKLIGPRRMLDPGQDGAEYDNYGQSIETHPIDTGRIVAVLEQVAKNAGWGRKLPRGRGLGIAVHRSFLSTVGTVAEVGKDANGKLRVLELWTVIDAGTVVNPDRVTAQMEGAGIFGMSLALYGEITARDGAIVQGNFDTYPVVRMNEAPANINVQIMSVDAPPGGVGEPGVPPVAPAIANAWFAATGERLRELPFRKAGIV
ncbi:MAG TPA: molybdopterin-dependent oxidoreductase [Woeseiaceae bacterium]|nr:molybdopterin-dependent oxidoreductase [Woeseiaceae bacterium]